MQDVGPKYGHYLTLLYGEAQDLVSFQKKIEVERLNIFTMKK